MKSLGGRNLVLPALKDFEKMGLRRSNQYECLTYVELLKKLQIETDPLKNAHTDYGLKVYDYACKELFIVPDAHPQQDEAPVHVPDKEPRSIDVGNEGLLERFAQLLYTGLQWEIPSDGSVQPLIDILSNLREEPDDKAINNTMQWTNRYGLLFTEPMPESLLENLYSARYLKLSDAVYRGVCAEYGNVPYFLGVKAFCELNRYALNLLFVAWLYSQEDKIKRISNHETAVAAIMEGYCLLNPSESISLDELSKEIYGNNKADETRYQRLRHYALRSLVRHMAVWVRLEAVAYLKQKDETGDESQGFLYLGEEPLEWAIGIQYQCASLFSVMMMEALSAINKKSRYRVCKFCKKVFDIGKGRPDRSYCSDGSESSSENCKGFSRYARERQNRQRKKEEYVQNNDL